MHINLKYDKVNQRQLALQWIPEHYGVAGKELADYLATKQGACILQASRNAIPFDRTTVNNS